MFTRRPFSLLLLAILGIGVPVSGQNTTQVEVTTATQTRTIDINHAPPAGPGQPPSVVLTAPLPSATIEAASGIVLVADAYDADGTVAKVEFFANGVKLGEATTAPYSYFWSDPAPGAHSLSVRATDNDGKQTVSATIGVTLVASGPGPEGYNFEPEEGYTVGILANQVPWQWNISGRDFVRVTDTLAQSGRQSMVIQPPANGSDLYYFQLPLSDYPQGQSERFVDFWWRPVADSNHYLASFLTLNGPTIAFIRSGPTAELQAVLNLEGAGGFWDSGRHVPVDAEGVVADWQRITIRLDLVTAEMDVYLNGQLALADLFYFFGSQSLGVFGHTHFPTYFDRLRVLTTNPFFTDADRDGMDDAWEAAHGLNPALNDRNADNDGDGVANIDECRLGTPPTDPADPDADGDDLPDQWERDHFGAGGTDPAADNDNDGVPNWQEFALGADPKNADSDRDELDDGLEIALGTDPLSPTADAVSEPTWLFRVHAINFVPDQIAAGSGLTGLDYGTPFPQHNTYKKLRVEWTVSGAHQGNGDFYYTAEQSALIGGYDGVGYLAPVYVMATNASGIDIDAELSPYSPKRFGWYWGAFGGRMMQYRYSIDAAADASWSDAGATWSSETEYTHEGTNYRRKTAYRITLSNSPEPVVYAPSQTSTYDSAWMIGTPHASQSSSPEGRYDRISCDYRLVVPRGTLGTIHWEEIYYPQGDPDHPLKSEKDWVVNGKIVSPSNTLSMSSNGAATVELVTLPPASLAVDTNRDGQIKLASEDASDATSSNKPYRFWINDDIDRWHVTNNDLFQTANEQDDISPTEAAANNWVEDWKSNTVQSRRDLEDFARIVVSTSGLSDAFRNGDLHLGLKWTDTVGTPSIKLYMQYNATGGTNYLTDDYQASVQLAENAILNQRYPGDDVASPSAHTVVTQGEVFVLPQALWFGLSGDALKRSLLFEGCTAGTGQLKLVIMKRVGTNYTEVGDGPGVWLDLQPIGNFYQTWTVGDIASSGVQKIDQPVYGYAPVPPSSTYSIAPGSPSFASPVTEEEKDFVLFVHGWNMPLFEKNRFAETAFKRLWWQGYKGRFGFFRWPTFYTNSYIDPTDSIGPPLDPQNFDASEWNSWRSAAGLVQLLTELKATYKDASGNSRVRVFAHSHGNLAVSEALRKAASPVVHTYVASQAAIAAHCFDRDPERVPDISANWQNGKWYLDLVDRLGLQPVSVATPNLYAYYPGNAGLNTNVQYPTAGQPYLTSAPGGGKWVNYYNQSDWALDSWITNQALKPDTNYRYSQHPGGLNPGDPPGWWFYAGGGFFYRLMTVPEDTLEIFSYAAQARSQPLGRQPGVMGLFNGQQTSWNVYGDKHPGHSAEFRSSISERGEYWRELLKSFDLQP